MTLETQAREFATLAHWGQVRKYTGEPYIVHPAAVAALVRTVPHTEEMLAAAWLHDVVEDTSVSLALIQLLFGAEVAGMVDELTDRSKLSDGKRAIRKEIDRQHTAVARPQAKTIKLADVYDNDKTIRELGGKFAEIWLGEKRALLEVLQEGDSTLYALVQTQVKTP